MRINNAGIFGWSDHVIEMQVCTKIPSLPCSAQSFALGYSLFSSILISAFFFIKIKNKSI